MGNFLKKYWKAIVSIIASILMILFGVLALLFNGNELIFNVGTSLSFMSVLFAIISVVFLTIIVIPPDKKSKENKFMVKFFSAIGFALFTTSIFDFYVRGNTKINLFLMMGLGLLYIIITSISDN